MIRSVFIPSSPVFHSNANMFSAAETDLPSFNSTDPPPVVHQKELGPLLMTTPYPLILALDRALEKRDQTTQEVQCLFLSLADLSER